MLIAVTYSDEVNMIACQVAHTLFNVPKKIARVRHGGYLNPAWSNLFSRDHMPIDVIISPEREVAFNIFERLKIPGTTDAISLLNGEAYCLSVICEPNCPILNTPLKQLETLFPDLEAKILVIERAGKTFLTDRENQLFEGDEVTFIVRKHHVERVLRLFGHEEKEARRLLMIGAGNIGTELAYILKGAYQNLDLRVVEASIAKAEIFSRAFPEDMVLHGDGLEKKVLEEVGIENIETVISVTNDDEVNILTALLAQEYGQKRTLTLVNKEIYNSLTGALNIHAIISPRLITASTIMKHVRRGRINATHNIKDDFAELIELRVSESCQIINTPLETLHLPPGVLVCMLRREETILMPDKETVIKPHDTLLIFATSAMVSEVEKLFSFNFDFF